MPVTRVYPTAGIPDRGYTGTAFPIRIWPKSGPEALLSNILVSYLRRSFDAKAFLSGGGRVGGLQLV